MSRLSPALRAEEIVLRSLRRCAHPRRRVGESRAPLSQRPEFRAVFISDVHIGMRASQLGQLCEFLEKTSAAELYLVGDIVDFWALERRPGPDQAAPRLLRLLHRLARGGTRVVLIPGNHDAALRAHIGRDPALDLHRDLVHRDANGRRLLVTHGDEADQVVTCHPFLSRTGAVLYDATVGVSLALNLVRRMAGLEYWNLAGALKRLVKRACTYIGDWEATLAAQVRARGLDGVICGHIHVPKIGEVAGIPYYNCGDWVEHATALAETWDGTFILLSFHAAAASARRIRNFRPRRLRLSEPRSGVTPAPA